MRRLGALGRLGQMKRPEGISQKIPNFNFEERVDFTKNYLKAVEQKECILQKLSLGQQDKNKANIKLDISDDLNGYYCWRNFNKLVDNDNIMNMLKPKGEFQATPKQMVQIFGLPNFADDTLDSNLGVFLFEDNFRGEFRIVDIQNKKSNFYQLRQTKGLIDAFEAFYQSEELQTFRFYVPRYSQYLKFKKYIKSQLFKYSKGELKSFFERMEERFGKAVDFNDPFVDYEDK